VWFVKIVWGVWSVVHGLNMKGSGKWGYGGVWKEKWEMWIYEVQWDDKIGDMKHFMPMWKKTLWKNYVYCNLCNVTRECLIQLDYN
jgi:hypothetical protein